MRIIEDLIENYIKTKERIIRIESVHNEEFQNQDESAQFEANEEVLQELDDIEYHFLVDIERAIEKNYNNNYGHCENCQNRIGKKRLQAIPHARLCMKCS